MYKTVCVVQLCCVIVCAEQLEGCLISISHRSWGVQHSLQRQTTTTIVNSVGEFCGYQKLRTGQALYLQGVSDQTLLQVPVTFALMG